MFLITSSIVINAPNRGLLAGKTMHAIVQRLENLNIKENMTSMFVNKKHRYTPNQTTVQYYILFILFIYLFATHNKIHNKQA